MAIVSTHPKMLHEVLNVINEHDDPVSALKACLHLSYVRQYLELAVSDDWSTLDVANTPTRSFGYHISMAGAFLLNRHTYTVVSEVIMRESVSDSAKAIQFKALMEMLYEEEAKIFYAILTKNLTSLYPQITFECLNEALFFNKVIV
jgi:hypothetical protein